MRPSFTPTDAIYQIPLLLLVVVGLALVLAEAFTRGRRGYLMQVAVAGCVAAVVAAIVLARQLGPGESKTLMRGMLVADRMSYFFIVLFAGATAITALLSPAHQREHEWENGEHYGILLLGASGMAILAMAADLVAVFIGIETMSLGVYVMTASRLRSRRGSEAALKYFLMGAFATGFLVYGMALVYGATGTTTISELSGAVGSLPVMLFGMFFMIIAFAFKVAAVPFHMWTPDAYEGAPTPVTGFMAAAVKAAAFAAMLRVFVTGFGGDVLPLSPMGWSGIFAVLGAITMTVGNIAALRQDNLKRMLAYSSVSHAGVLLVGVAAAGAAGPEFGVPAVMFYLLAYTLTTLGAFAVIVWIGSRDNERVFVSDWNGLAATHGGAALAMTIAMLSLGGMPPTAGFVGKFYVFKAAMHAPDSALLWLVVIGVLNSVISIFYYLRVVMAMYFRPASGEFQPLRSGGITFAMVLCAIGILIVGMMPGYFLGLIGS